MESEILEFLHSGCLLSVGSHVQTSAVLSRGTEQNDPDQLWMGWGAPSRVSRPSSCGFSVYAPDFFLEDPHPWWIFPTFKRVKRSDLIQSLTAFVQHHPVGERSDGALSEMDWVEPEFEIFRSAFLDLQNHFLAGRLKKAVPVVFEKAHLELDIRHRAYFLLKMLINTKNIPVYPYGIWSQGEGILGATPEILFSQSSEGALHTAALAGTRFKNSAHLPLLEDPKELEEHRIVVDGICSSLSGFGSVKVGETQELTLPVLSHLLTPIVLEIEPALREVNSGRFFEEIVTKLHPTPALGAFPRVEGMAWLRTFQTRFDRLRMGAPFGVVGDQGESQCVVSIRNIQWKKSTLYLGAGCGIISASQLDREWREVLGKIQSIKRVFGLEAV